jgi:hypothetical protein
MLSSAIVYVALIALVATTILSAGLAMTRMTILRAAQPYLAAGYERAVSSLQQTVAAEMQSGGIPDPAPAFSPIAPACADSACKYTTSETIALVQNAPATPGAACDPAQTNCAPNVQVNPYVSEGRMTARITVNVQDSAGSIIVTRAGDLVLRTMRSPPYVALAGARDTTFDDVSDGQSAGDDGGAPADTPNPCATPVPGTSSDTTVRVAYHNTKSGACGDGSAWADASYRSPVSSGGWTP